MNEHFQGNGKDDIKTIILADDDSDDSFIFRQVIEETAPDKKVTIVADGVELLNLLKNFRPDILFLDLDMPYKNGLECIREIRATDSLKDLPVIVFSSTTRPANIQTAYDIGADLFFIKPSVFSDLSSALQTILSLDWRNREAIKEQYCVNGRFAAFG